MHEFSRRFDGATRRPAKTVRDLRSTTVAQNGRDPVVTGGRFENGSKGSGPIETVLRSKGNIAVGLSLEFWQSRRGFKISPVFSLDCQSNLAPHLPVFYPSFPVTDDG